MRAGPYQKLFIGIGLGSLALAALLYVCPWGESPGLVIAEPNRVVEGLLPGESRAVAFRIENRTSRPRRVVGTSHL